MDLPIKGKVTSGFGMRVDPISKKEKFHYGIDIGAQKGTPLKANLAGNVLFSGWKSGYGNVVILETGEIEQTFGHLDSLNVKQGQQVNVGDLLGKIGSTGYSTGNHLHWELSYLGAKQDPTKFNPSWIDTTWQTINKFFGDITGIKGLEGEQIDLKSAINDYMIKIVLVMLLIVFIVLAFYPGNKNSLVKGVFENAK